MNKYALGMILHRIVMESTGGRVDWSDLSDIAKASMQQTAEWFVAQGSAPPRYARVSLMGKRVLGLVRVTEATLCGAPMLRCEADGQEPLWVNPAAIYTLAEVTDETAQAEIAKRVADEEASRAKKAAEESALRDARYKAEAAVVFDRVNGLVAIRTSAPDLIHHADRDLFRAQGIHATLQPLYVRGEHVGVVLGCDEASIDARIDDLATVARALGFGSVGVRGVSADDPEEINDASIPF